MRGSCLCGDIAFEIDGPVEPLAHCHCSMCRKVHGSAFASFVSAPATSFRWLRGQEKRKRFAAPGGVSRPFCPRCGSAVPGDAQGERVYPPAGLLEIAEKLAPMQHWFVGSKAPWHEISDRAQRFDAYPTEFGGGEGLPTRRNTDPKPGVVRGACLCGAVAYECDAPIDGVIVCCHCSRCRKARAAAHATNAFVPLARFRWLRGQDRVDSFKVPEADRFTQAFCRDCGSAVPRANPLSQMAVIPAGSFEDDPGVREGAHIFVASKAPWYAIEDALPQYSEYRPT